MNDCDSRNACPLVAGPVRFGHRPASTFFLRTLMGFALWVCCCGVAVTPALAGWPADPAPVVHVTYQLHGKTPEGTNWKRMGQALIGLNLGDTVTPELLSRALSRFEPLGKAEAREDITDQGLSLTIQLSLHQRIKSIHIHNGYPLFESEIRGAMTIASGAVFDAAVLMAQEEMIARLYREEGYIAPRVTIDWAPDDDAGHMRVDVTIDKGSAYEAAQLEISGNNAYSATELQTQLAHNLWRKNWLGSGRFSKKRLKEGIDALVRFYRLQGYADVRIASQVARDPKNRGVDVRLTIDEGPHYSIQFSGNRFFADNILAKDLVIFESGNRGNVGLRRSIQNIRRRYLQAGFADVRLQRSEAPTDRAPEDADARVIRVEIDEGLRHIVEAVNIVGNQRLSDDTIKDQMLTRSPKGLNNGVFVNQVLQEDLNAVLALYTDQGFMDVHLTDSVDIDPQSKSVSVTLTIQEGVRTRVTGIRFSGDLPVAEAELRKVLRLNFRDPYRTYMMENDRNQLASRIAAVGYPYVQVDGRLNYSEDRRGVQIDYHIEPGPLVRVGLVAFLGSFRTSPDILFRELGFDEGAPFSLDQTLKAQRNLRDLNLFESVQVRTIGLKEKASTVHLIFETPEKRPYFFELGGGYTTDKGFYLRSKTGDHNFGGTNKDVWMGGEAGETGYRLDAGISNPRLWGTHVRTDLGIFVEHREEFNQNFGTDSRGGTLNFSYRWSPRIATSLGLRYEQRTQFTLTSDASTLDDPSAYEDRIFWVTTPSVSYDSRDSFIRPTRGIFSSISVDISSGLKGSLDNFLRYQADLRGFYTPYPRLTLAAIGRVGYLAPLGADDELPDDQLFFLGGTVDVRGFGENLLRYDANGNPVGGRLALSTALEARYEIKRNLELALFVDGGSLQEALSSAGDDDWHWAAGLGLRYLTPIGPIGLLYGQKIDPRPGESKGQWHFSIGYTF